MRVREHTSLWHLGAVALVAIALSVAALPAPGRAAIQQTHPRRVNAPYFASSVNWSRSAIFWFGQNQQGVPSRNYADVRVGYTNSALSVRVTVVDYALWYPTSPTAATDLTQYDAAAIYLDTGHNRSAAPQTDDYWFLSAYRWDGGNNNPTYQRRARGTGSGWNTAWAGAWTDAINSDWNCDPGPNSNACGIDNGWTAFFTIPFASIGLSGPPANGTVIGFGVALYDRDDLPPAGAVAPQGWPETFNANAPNTWAELRFGDPSYSPPQAIPRGSALIRAASPTDNTVQDAWMGGGGLCNGGQFGGSTINHGADPALYIGTEVRSVHFPCFNKSFLRFSLSAIPPGKVILSASLTLHLWGSADPAQAQRSWVSLFTIRDPWDEMTVHWNNAPLAFENVSATYVYTYSRNPIVWPGDPYTWNATQAVAEAYARGEPLSVALYGSDTTQHSSKYLTASEVDNWNVAGRPRLDVIWGDAANLPRRVFVPRITR